MEKNFRSLSLKAEYFQNVLDTTGTIYSNSEKQEYSWRFLIRIQLKLGFRNLLKKLEKDSLKQ